MLTVDEYRKRQATLRSIIFRLSVNLTDGDEIKKILNSLKDIYTYDDAGCCEFRHEYSYIFGIINEIKNGNIVLDGEQEKGSIDTLADNIRILHDTVYGQSSESYVENVHKLYDHVNLEIGRINYIDKIQKQLMDSEISLSQTVDEAREDYNTLKTEISSINESISETENKMSNSLKRTEASYQSLEKKFRYSEKSLNSAQSKMYTIENKIENMQRETITILGLFSAVVLVFMGGVGFSSSVLESMSQTNIYKLSLTCLLLGIIFTNVVYLLLRFILFINKSYIKIRFKDTKFTVLIKTINIIFLSLILIVCILWFIDIKIFSNWFQNLISKYLNT